MAGFSKDVTRIGVAAHLLRMEPEIMQGVGFLSLHHCRYLNVCKVQPQGQEVSRRAMFNALPSSTLTEPWAILYR